MMYSANFGSQAEDAIKISSKNNIKPTKIILGHQQTWDIEKGEETEDNVPNVGCIRMLHKMVGNTTKHYRIEEVFDADQIMTIYEQNYMIQKYSKIATLDQDMRMLSSIIDFGEKPLHFALNPNWVETKLDGVRLADDGILIPNKKPKSSVRLENEASNQPNETLSKQEKIKKYKSMLALPPRPSAKLDVVTYGECSSILKLNIPEESNSKLLEREVSPVDIDQTINEANQILKSLKGKVATFDRMLLFYLVFGMLVCGLLGFIFGFFVHFVISIIFVVVYFALLTLAVYFYKKRTTSLIIHAHFWLALYLHWENHRYYLERNIRLRPGFMAKWIEILYIPQKTPIK